MGLSSNLPAVLAPTDRLKESCIQDLGYKNGAACAVTCLCLQISIGSSLIWGKREIGYGEWKSEDKLLLLWQGDIRLDMSRP